VGDAKIVAIEPSQVRIQWEGKEIVLAPIQAVGAPGPKKKAKKPIADKAESKEIAEKPMQEKVTAAPVDPLAWMGVKLSAALRAKFLEKWNQMSDEQKAKAKEQWNSMSDEQKQQAVDAMEKNL
jgi:hypothetical protein